ncbi:MAG: hypothetical protein IPK13_11140 [Deltaproteobacteria bacterium]|nr:hypothetical protein [Deltaproteobacteria bacterium]
MATIRGEWIPRRSTIDLALFEGDRLGPFIVGAPIRHTLLGDVRMALEDGVEHVVEIERFDVLGAPEFGDLQESLILDLAGSTDIAHRHVAEVTGAGLYGGVPYVVRPHRLGRLLSDVLAHQVLLPPDVVPVIAHHVGEALAYLAFEGFSMGAWSLGGFDEHDVFLGFDGSVMLNGVGLAKFRAPGRDPVKADLESYLTLLTRLDSLADSSVAKVVEAHGRLDDVSLLLRRRYREEVGHGETVLGSLLREAFSEQIIEERAFFGMSTLH